MFYFILFLNQSLCTEDSNCFHKHLLSFWPKKHWENIGKKYSHIKMIYILMVLLNTALIAHLNRLAHLKNLKWERRVWLLFDVEENVLLRSKRFCLLISMFSYWKINYNQFREIIKILNQNIKCIFFSFGGMCVLYLLKNLIMFGIMFGRI